MKYMKKIRTFLLLCLLFIGFSSSVFASVIVNRSKNPNQQRSRAISAPLDGGILALLGAAGVGYYLIRKKKKNKAEI